MMNANRKPEMTISAFQLGTMIVGVMLSLGPLIIGRVAAERAGRDGWLVTIIASVFILLGMWLMVRLAKRYPDQTVSEYSAQILGPVFGKLIGIVIILLGASSCALTLWYTGHLFSTYILLLTPRHVISLCLILLTAYVALCELRTIGRVVLLIFFISMPFNLFFVSPVLNHGDWKNVLPFFSNDWSTLAIGVLGVCFAFAGFEVTQSYFPYVRNQQKVMTHAMLGVVFVSVLFVLACLTQQLVYPLDYLTKIWAPSIQYVALVSIPIIERSDMIFILFWFVVLFKTNTMYFFRTVIEIRRVFGVSQQRLIIAVLSLIVYCTSMISLSIEQMEVYLIAVFSTSVFFAIGLTLTLLIVDSLKKRRTT